MMLLGLSSCGSHLDYVQSYYYNQKYKYFLKQKDYEKAQTAELAAKENLQDHFELDSNLGVIFNLLNQNEASQKSFDEALKVIPEQYPKESDREKAYFVIYFNRGAFFQSQNKIDEALKNYQAALDVNPTSKETKHNIELLIQKQKKDQEQKEGQNGQKDQQGQGQDKKPNEKPGQDPQKKPDQKEGQDDKKESQGQDRKQTTKYQPRPFKGDQLSEGDVKKILGELSQQDKKIRAQFDKKEKNESGIEGKNEKDW